MTNKIKTKIIQAKKLTNKKLIEIITAMQVSELAYVSLAKNLTSHTDINPKKNSYLELTKTEKKEVLFKTLKNTRDWTESEAKAFSERFEMLVDKVFSYL